MQKSLIKFPKKLSQSETNKIYQNYTTVNQFRKECKEALERLTVETGLANNAI